MRKIVVSIVAALAAVEMGAQEKSVLPPITTDWGECVTPDNVWKQYPRPMMKRQEWMNLNGKWDYAILPEGSAKPQKYDGDILVPFPVESSLSGVCRKVGDKNELWYHRQFEIPSGWMGKDINLNFGGVDWQADVWINDIYVGGHKGAYSPFSINITEALAKGDNELLVRVYDPTDKGTQPRGKQVLDPEGVRPRGIWYTPVTGIWQTVWLEPVAKNNIEGLKITPDVDGNKLVVEPSTSASRGLISLDVSDNGKVVAKAFGMAGKPIEINMPEDVKLWWPENPHIYDLKICLMEAGIVVDSVESYAAMRKVGIKRGKDKVKRFTLNDKELFHFGPLDQGWWPDGLYTPPSYDAMIYDIDKTKEMGFNMIRKHIKVEPQLWYEYCDRNGILVWQDMPSGDKNTKWENHNYYKSAEYERNDESAKQYRVEWEEIMDNLHSHPSIVVWVPFNEGWGQFDTKNIASWTKMKDPSRLVNAASGGNFFYGAGDILDVHNYPAPRIYLLDDDKANVIGEYGGIGYPVKGHLWQPDKNWGYIQFKSPKEVTDKYVEYVDILDALANIAYTGAVYTQTTDVEGEVNGLMTYDRKKLKVELERIREANRRLINKYSEKADF
ncbi:MAG: beta-galactosidase [Muribaculaceae bacterium]|nr:beta-galactosidase [Muribaculaceae bacterium]